MERSLEGVDLNLLPALQALLTERSVTRAARSVGMSQPAMSHCLRRLRVLFEDELLVRRGKEYQLTPRARALREPVNDGLSIIQSRVLRKEVFDAGSSTRRFRVGTSAATTMSVLHPLLERLGTEAPRVAVQLLETPREPDVLIDEKNVDLMLIPDMLRTAHPRTRVYSEDWVVIGWAGNRSLGADTLTFDTFVSLPHVVYESERPTVAYLSLLARGIELRNSIVSDNFLAIYHLVRGTNALAILQRGLTRALGSSDDIRVFESPVSLPRYGVDLVWDARAEHDPGHAWLRTRIMEHCAAKAATGGGGGEGIPPVHA